MDQETLKSLSEVEDDASDDTDKFISPPSGAESLFLGDVLKHNKISPSVLAKQLERERNQPRFNQHNLIGNSIGFKKKWGSSFSTYSRASSNMSSTNDDDFMSCAENHSDIDSIDSNENALVSPRAAVHPSPFHMETIEDTTFTNPTDDKMAKNKKNRNHSNKKSPQRHVMFPHLVTGSDGPEELPVKDPVEKSSKKHHESIFPHFENDLPDTSPRKEEPPAAPRKEEPPAAPEKDDGMKVDAAEIVYGKAKDILLWGKSVPVVSFFVGTSEAVAGKALGVVGTDLSELDAKLESELTKFDTGILNPAIETIAKVMIGVAGKTEETLKPVIEALLGPFLKLIKSEAYESKPDEHTANPEVTVTE